MIIVHYSDELYHHGILGQKWGKKNGPPYPLEPSSHSSSEKSAGWRKSLNKKESSEKNQNGSKKGLTNSAKAAIVIGAVATAGAIYYAKNPDKVKKLVERCAKQISEDVISLKSKDYMTNPRFTRLASEGKEFVKEQGKNIVTNVTSGSKAALGKSAKIVGTGVTMLAAKEIVDIVAGKQNADRIYKANNNKKIDSFWKKYNETLNNNGGEKGND